MLPALASSRVVGRASLVPLSQPAEEMGLAAHGLPVVTCKEVWNCSEAWRPSCTHVLWSEGRGQEPAAGLQRAQECPDSQQERQMDTDSYSIAMHVSTWQGRVGGGYGRQGRWLSQGQGALQPWCLVSGEVPAGSGPRSREGGEAAAEARPGEPWVSLEIQSVEYSKGRQSHGGWSEGKPCPHLRG